MEAVLKESSNSSICDKCLKPGSCCKGIFLNNDRIAFDKDGSEWNQAHNFMANVTNSHAVGENKSMPFYPVQSFNKKDGKVYFMWACKNIGDNGRCMDYESRPNTCRLYEPMMDGLCTMAQLDDQEHNHYFSLQKFKSREPDRILELCLTGK